MTVLEKDLSDALCYSEAAVGLQRHGDSCGWNSPLIGEKEARERMKIKFTRMREIVDRGDAIESVVRFVVQSLGSH